MLLKVRFYRSVGEALVIEGACLVRSCDACRPLGSSFSLHFQLFLSDFLPFCYYKTFRMRRLKLTNKEKVKSGFKGGKRSRVEARRLRKAGTLDT
jgi:hypothetical protein